MTVTEAQAYCETVTKRSGSNFAYSFLFLPPARRAAMYAVYAFCKEVDTAVDDPPPGSDPHREIEAWRRELEAAYRGSASRPVTISLAEHARTLAIPKAYFEDLISGVEMDLTIRRYQTFDALSLYCYRVASVVGLICLHVFGTRSVDARDYAINLGLAFQLTNIIRDVGTDAAQNRIYLPQEDLLRFGYPESDLLAQSYSPNFEGLMAFECRRAKDYYEQAQAAAQRMPAVDRRALTVAEIMRGVYRRILERIEQSHYRVYERRIGLSRPYRLAIAVGVWIRSLLLR